MFLGVTSQVNCLSQALHASITSASCGSFVCVCSLKNNCRNQGKIGLPSFFIPGWLRSLEMSHPFLSISVWWPCTNAKKCFCCRVYPHEQNIVLAPTLRLRMGHEPWRKEAPGAEGDSDNRRWCGASKREPTSSWLMFRHYPDDSHSSSFLTWTFDWGSSIFLLTQHRHTQHTQVSPQMVCGAIAYGPLIPHRKAEHRTAGSLRDRSNYQEPQDMARRSKETSEVSLLFLITPSMFLPQALRSRYSV